jgi:hypothetical protein
MKPGELFYTLDEIIEVLGRDVVIRCVSNGLGCFPGILAPLTSNIDKTSSVVYAEVVGREVAAYKSLWRLVIQGVFEPTSPPEKISMESLKSGQP